MKKEDREKLLDEEQARIKNIVSAPVDDMRYLWDETVRQYAVEMEKVKRLLTQKGVPEQVGEGTLRRMQNFVCDTVKVPTVIVQNSPSHRGNFPIKSGAP